MTVNRLRSRPTETRTSGPAMQNNWASGYWADPTAIPPPNLAELQRAGVVVNQKSMLQVDVVFTALRIITTSILKMGDLRAYEDELNADNVQWRKYKKKQPAILTDTWGGLYQYDGRRRTIMSMALLGEAFWYSLLLDDEGQPEAFEVLHPLLMEVLPGPEYLYGTGAKKKKLDASRVTHIPFMAMPQGHRGLNPLDYASVASGLALAAYQFGSAWFSQGASPSFQLLTDRKLGQAEIDRLAMKFMTEHSGLNNSHLPLVLDNGLKAEKVLSSPDEAQYLQTLEYARSVIASWFGVPSTLLPNALQRQTPMPPHTSQEEVMRFLMYTLSGYTVPLEEAFSNHLPGNEKAAFIEDGLSRPDTQFLAQEIMALRNTQVASINDLRTRKLHWPPLDDPRADEAINPLASNTAEGEGGAGTQSELATPPPNKPADAEGTESEG